MSSIKAVLFGLNYIGTNNELSGCINDVNLMNNCLKNYLKVPETNISIFHDNTEIKPYSNNIIRILNDAIDEVNNSSNLKTLWIHYSGHGSYINDLNDDEEYMEIDGSLYYGYDEVLCPLSGKYIKDDDLNLIFSRLKEDKKLICVFDCCHSGTALDLPYRYDYNKNICIEEKNKNLIKCDAMLLSGAKDSQTAADAPGLSSKYLYTGAFTTSILKACENEVTVSLDKIIDYAAKYLKDNGLWQIPVVTSSRNITLKTEFMSSNYRKSINAKIKYYEKYINLCDHYYIIYKDEVYKKYKEYFIKRKNSFILSLV